MASKEQRIKDALRAIGNGIKIRRAGRLYGIPESTLRCRMKPNATGNGRGHPTLFNEAEENLLANHCIKMANIGYELAPWQVVELAETMAKEKGVEKPTRSWFQYFKKRNPELVVRQSRKRDRAREVVSEEIVNNYFKDLETALKEANVEEAGVIQRAKSRTKKKGIEKPTRNWYQFFEKRHPKLIMKMRNKGKRTRETGDTSLSEGMADILPSSSETLSHPTIQTSGDTSLSDGKTKIQALNRHAPNSSPDGESCGQNLLQIPENSTVPCSIYDSIQPTISLMPELPSNKQKAEAATMNEREKQIEDALNAIANGIQIRRASRLYGVPESTLRTRMKPRPYGGKIGHPCNFTDAEENLLANHCLEMANTSSGLAPSEVIKLAESMAEKKGIEKPTKSWFQLFKKRHPELVMKLCKKGKRTREPGDTSISEGMADILASNRETPMKDITPGKTEAAKRANRRREKDNREKRIKAAVRAVQTGTVLKKAAEMYNIPKTTLRRRKMNDCWKSLSPFNYNTVFNKEELLAQHCLMMESLGYRFEPWQIMQMAKDMAEFSGATITPTNSWLNLFLERFPNILLESDNRSDDATDELIQETVDRYFSYLEPFLEQLNIKNAAQHIWNVDEIGISLDYDPPKVLTDAKEKSYHIAPGKFQTMSLTAAVSALGETIPPFLTFKGEEITPAMREGVPPGTVFKSSVDGWSTFSLFQSFFFNHLLKYIKIRPLLILYDGHITHYSAQLIRMAMDHNVHLFVLPPHSSQTLQSELSIFNPFKKLLTTNVENIKQSTDSTTIDELPGIICSSFKKAMSKPAIMSGFEKCGILPLNKGAIARTTTAGGENLQIDSLVDFKITTFELS